MQINADYIFRYEPTERNPEAGRSNTWDGARVTVKSETRDAQGIMYRVERTDTGAAGLAKPTELHALSALDEKLANATGHTHMVNA